MDEKNNKISLKQRFLFWFLPLVISLLQRFIGVTSRRIDIGKENLDGLKETGRSWIFSIWHTNVLYSPYLNRNMNVAVMISSSRDGEYITNIVERFGNFGIRGSTSRGGLKALRALIHHLKKSGCAAFTPDGPRGPAFKVQSGIITAAANSGVPIVPFHYECTRQWIAKKAWDQHRVPKPFTTFIVSYGKPIFVPPALPEEEFEKARENVERAMLDNMELCRQKADELRKA